MTKNIIETKLLEIVRKLGLPVLLLNRTSQIINYTIPSAILDDDSQIYISISDTDTKEYRNEFGISIVNCEEDDEIEVYGFGTSEYEKCTLRNIENILKEQCFDTYQITCATESRVFTVYEKTQATLSETKKVVEQKYNCKVISISNYLGTINENYA